MSRMWAGPAATDDKVPATTRHARPVLTSDGVRHAETDVMPCWCGATDVDPRGLNVLSSEDWTAGGISTFLESVARWLKAVPSRVVVPEPVDLATLSESALMAAWTASDGSERVALDAEMTRRDQWETTETHTAASTNVDAEYAAYLHSQYLEACTATRSYMVSKAGQARGYTSTDFFKVGRRPSVERWGTDELRAWFGSANAAGSDTAGFGHVLSKGEYVAMMTQRVPVAA